MGLVYWQVNHKLGGLGVEAAHSCFRSADCASECPRDGICTDFQCNCMNSIIEPSESKDNKNGSDKSCKRDVDCSYKCPKGGLCDMKRGKCFCWPKD